MVPQDNIQAGIQDCRSVPWVWISPHAIGFTPMITSVGTREHIFSLNLPSRLVPSPSLLINKHANVVDLKGDMLLQKLLYVLSQVSNSDQLEIENNMINGNIYNDTYNV